MWPAVVQANRSKEKEAEAKLVKKVFAGATEMEGNLHQVLEKNEEGLYECRGRIQGSYSIYLPPDALLTERIVHDKQVQSQCLSTTLGTSDKTAHKDSYQRMLWVQEIPSYRSLKPTSYKIANRQDRRISPFPSSWPRLCRTNRVQTQDKEKAKIVYFVISLQLNQELSTWRCKNNPKQTESTAAGEQKHKQDCWKKFVNTDSKTSQVYGEQRGGMP